MRQAHLALKVDALGIAMRPLELRRRPLFNGLQFFRNQFERTASIGLYRRAELGGADFKQVFAVHLEQLDRVFIDVDKLRLVHIDYDDSFRRVFDQAAETRFAGTKGLLDFLALADIAQATDVDFLLSQHRFTDRQLGREQLAVLAFALGFPGLQVIGHGRGQRREFAQKFFHPPPRFGNQQFQRAPAQLVFAKTENPFAGRVENSYRTVFIEREDRILDVVENGLQPVVASLANFLAEVGEIVRDHLDRVFGFQAFLVLRAVILINQRQQLIEIGRLAALAARLFELLSEFLVHRNPCR
ncbi:hypothetical protein MnTg04_01404 [bacterium MnTg04]|nr:hypothetical protein MnTg04_01404 [bacterium MnTg04]